ncbi:unnamed protein product [Chrysoparadoxa australica]
MDPATCLEILSGRGSEPHEHGDHADGTEGGCTAAEKPTGPSYGQTINLWPSGEARPKEPEGKETSGPVQEKFEEGNQRLDEMREVLEGMNAQELGQSFLRAQQERVQAYARYNGALEEMISSSQCANYTGLCGEVTATFAVLSSGINVMEEVMKGHSWEAMASCVRSVQKLESQKLLFTAALHMETMRSAGVAVERAPSSVVGTNSRGTEEGGKSIDHATRVGDLLEQGISSLKRNIAEVEAGISEHLEELRYEMDGL